MNLFCLFAAPSLSDSINCSDAGANPVQSTLTGLRGLTEDGSTKPAASDWPTQSGDLCQAPLRLAITVARVVGDHTKSRRYRYVLPRYLHKHSTYLTAGQETSFATTSFARSSSTPLQTSPTFSNLQRGCVLRAVATTQTLLEMASVSDRVYFPPLEDCLFGDQVLL
jgi:hypothetical protein